MTRAVIPALALAVIACSGGQRRPPSNAPKTAQAMLLKALSWPLPATLQGMTRLEAYVEGKARKADVLLRAKRPGRVQFQALTPSLDLIAVTSTDGRRFTSFERGAPQCFVGPACPENLARMVPIEMPPAQLVEAVLGRPPVLQGTPSAMTWDAAKGAFRVELVDSSGKWRQRLWVDGATLRFRASVLYNDGKLVVSIAYSDWMKQGPPKLMRLKIPARKVDMSVQLRDVTVNEDIDDQDFVIPCPSGTEVIELPCAVTAGVQP